MLYIVPPQKMKENGNICIAECRGAVFGGEGTHSNSYSGNGVVLFGDDHRLFISSDKIPLKCIVDS